VRREVVDAGGMQEAVEGNRTACLIGRDRLQPLDARRSFHVELMCDAVIVKMAQVGADNDARFRAAPKFFEHHAYFRFIRATNDQRNELEMAQHRLQKGEVNFERVLVRVRGLPHSDARQVEQRFDGLVIDRDSPSGVAKTLASLTARPENPT